MSGKNKLLKWQVTQSKKLKNYSSDKYVRQGSKTALAISLSWLIFVCSIKKKKKTWGMLFSCYQKN